MWLHTHKIARVATSLAQRCTSWCRQHRACVRTPDTTSRNIIGILDSAPVEAQAPLGGEPMACLIWSSFCGFSSSNVEPPDYGSSGCKLSIAAAVLLLWWWTRAPWKAHDPSTNLHVWPPFRRPNIPLKLRLSSVPSNLLSDSMALTRTKQNYCIDWSNT